MLYPTIKGMSKADLALCIAMRIERRQGVQREEGDFARLDAHLCLTAHQIA